LPAPVDDLDDLPRLAHPLTFGYDSPAMDPAVPAAHPTPRFLAPGSRIAGYLPWLKVKVALRYALTFPWTPDAWREARQRIPWFLAKQSRVRKAGWFN